MSSVATLTFYLGEDITVSDTIYQADGFTPQDITGWSVSFVVHGTSALPAITKTTGGGGVVLTQPTNGLLTVSLLASDTASLAPGNYQFYTSRTDSGSQAVLTSGMLILLSR